MSYSAREVQVAEIDNWVPWCKVLLIVLHVVNNTQPYILIAFGDPKANEFV
jgi:hypothetical protein